MSCLIYCPKCHVYLGLGSVNKDLECVRCGANLRKWKDGLLYLVQEAHD